MYSLVQSSLKIHFKVIHSFTTNFTNAKNGSYPQHVQSNHSLATAIMWN